MSSTIEPFRKGTSFTDWADRLIYTFDANEVKDDKKKKAHFMNLCGPFLYTHIKSLYNETERKAASFEDIITKLKQKLDKVDPDLIQRYRFSHRSQQVEETAEEFVQAVKLQAEFCGFGDFKDVAIMDRVLAGLSDEGLKEMLLKEEKLTLATMDKLITTWNVARENARSLNQNNSQYFPVGFIDQYSQNNNICPPGHRRKVH